METAFFGTAILVGTVCGLVSLFQYLKNIGEEYMQDEEALGLVYGVNRRIDSVRARLDAFDGYAELIGDPLLEHGSIKRALELHRSLLEIESSIASLLAQRSQGRIQFYTELARMIDTGAIFRADGTTPARWEIEAEHTLDQIGLEVLELWHGSQTKVDRTSRRSSLRRVASFHRVLMSPRRGMLKAA